MNYNLSNFTIIAKFRLHILLKIALLMKRKLQEQVSQSLRTIPEQAVIK